MCLSSKLRTMLLFIILPLLLYSKTANALNLQFNSNLNDAWQKRNAEKIADKPINKAPLLGSHDTGSYDINRNSFLTPDATSAIHVAYNMGLRSKIQGWAKTQTIDVATQLALGVRYFDLRLCGTRYGGIDTNKNNDLYTCHSLSGAPLKKIIQDVKNFIDTPGHEQEIVLLDIGRLYNVNEEQIAQLTELLMTKINCYMQCKKI